MCSLTNSTEANAHLGYQTFQTISQGKMYECESQILSLSDQKTSIHIEQEQMN